MTQAEDNSKWIILRLLSDELVILQNVDNSDDLIDVLLPELLQREQGTSYHNELKFAGPFAY